MANITAVLYIVVVFLFLTYWLYKAWASLVAKMVKNLPAMLETWVQSLSWEDLLEKGMTLHFSILAWRIARASQRVRHN